MSNRLIRSRFAATLALFLAAAALNPSHAQQITDRREGVLFRFDARAITPKPKVVYLAGSFNGWNPTGEAMVDEGNGFYSLKKKLPDGLHYYKFVIDGDRWMNDPNDDTELRADDGNGGLNSAVLIGLDGRRLPPPVKGEVHEQAVIFDIKDSADLNVVSQGRLQLSLKVQANDVEQVNLWITSPGQPLRRVPLTKASTALGFDRFTGLVPISGHPVNFSFELLDGGKSFYLLSTGLASAANMDRAFTVDPKLTFATPDWAKNAVWYQIFAERFRNGDPSNDPGDKPYERLVRWQADWWKTQPGEAPGEQNFYYGEGNVWKRRFGGDLQGVREKLPYLKKLGITAIYFNPMFEAASMHKYDTTDFRHIDDNFTVREKLPLEGETDDPSTWKWSKGDLMFLDFVQEARRQGFKVILDGVFNHTGREHPFFQDVVQKGPASKYADWFEIEKFADHHPAKESEFGKPGGLQFKAWDGPSGHLPVFKKDPVLGLAKGPREHIMAITRRWLAPDGNVSRGIDGWRLDVANDIPHPFWIEWRKLVKSINPDAYISGEIWTPANPWLRGDQFDGVMNYQFAMAGQKFFVRQNQASKPSEFVKELDRLTNLYPLQSVMVLQNLYDSHDTDRLASMIVNGDLPYDSLNRLQDANGRNYSKAPPSPEQWERFKQAVTFQMTFIGAPMIYYGSEAGMWSPDDPSNRMPMVWKDLEPYDDPNIRFNESIFNHYQRVVALRHSLPVLNTGYLRPLLADDERNVVTFVRESLQGEQVVVVLNRSNRTQSINVPLANGVGETWIDWMDSASTELIEESPAHGGRPALRPLTASPRVTVQDGVARVSLKPWGVAVIAPK